MKFLYYQIPNRYMMFTLDDFDLNGSDILMRCDLNSPIEENKIRDKTKIEACVPTIKELIDRGANVTILSHQGRPFSGLIDLDLHAEELEELLEKKVEFCDSVFSSTALEKIKENEGVLLLNNTRLYSEEAVEISLDKCENSYIVKKFKELFDYYVNDAFGAVHRSQVSLIGFAREMPMISGKLMQDEINALKKAKNSDISGPKALILGGAKVDDSLEVVEEDLKANDFDHILTVGVVGLVFLLAKGYNLGEKTIAFIEKNNLFESVKKAEELLGEGFKKIKTPVDLAMDWNGRIEIKVPKLEGDERTDTHLFPDIGSRTVMKYGKIIENSELIIMNGPAGKYENEKFMKGTKGIFEKISQSEGFSNIGGGHTLEAYNETNFQGVSHISTGGGAMLSYLSGKELPVLNAFEESYKLFSE